MTRVGQPARRLGDTADPGTSQTSNAPGTTWSGYLDVVSSDAARGAVVRVSHDPDADRAEIWVHAFVDGRIIGRVGPADCPALGAATTRGTTSFAHLDLPGRALQARAQATDGDRTPYGDGPVPVEIEASWSEPIAVGANLHGRAEQIVRVTADVAIDGATERIEGLGHQHVQEQRFARFGSSFTYVSVRGETTGLVGLIAPRRRQGFGYDRDARFVTDDMTIDMPAAVRRVSASSTPTRQISGSLTATYRYWIPLGGTSRESTLVRGRLGGHAVTGVVNDLALPAVEPVAAPRRAES